MEIIEYFFDLSPKNNYFKKRKLLLPENDSFLLFGSRGTGKTALLLSYLNALEISTWLYIDCQDPIFALEDIDTAMLNSFIKDKNIQTVALDHYYDGFLEELPISKQLIVVSREQALIDMDNKLGLYPLDYEEFLSFDKSHTSNFNHFFKAGTLPMTAMLNLHSLPQRFRDFFYSSFDEDESRLMLILAKHQGQRVTTHQIYTYAKEYFRISKDWVYKTIKKFAREELIVFIDDSLNKGARKMFLYDFALSKYLSKSQAFPVTFDAMVVLALYKHHIRFEALGIHGYLIHKHELIVPSAFENEDIFWRKSYEKTALYKKYNITKVTVVSVSSSYTFKIGNINFEALPFYEWSIINEEY